MKGTVGAETLVRQNCTKKKPNHLLESIQWHLKERVLGLIIRKDCVLQTVDRTNLASRFTGFNYPLKRHTIII